MSMTIGRSASGFLGLAVLTVLIGCSPAPVPKSGPTTAPAPAATPLKVTGVTIGRSLGADKSIAERTDRFMPADTFYASVRTEGSSPGATLMARWTYEGGQLVEESSQTIASAGGSHVSEFHVSKPDGWPSGSYAVDVFLNGLATQRQGFRVN